MRVGYARVSKKRQKLHLQYHALDLAKCDLVISEKAPGDVKGRLGLAGALALCREGDVLVVWKIDRLGRDPFELIELMKLMHRRGIRLEVLTGQASSIDISSEEGRKLYTIYAAIAGIERGQNGDRATAGLVAARSRLGQRTRKLLRHTKAVSRRDDQQITLALRSVFTSAIAGA